MDLQEFRSSKYYNDRLKNQQAQEEITGISDKLKNTGIDKDLVDKVKDLLKYILSENYYVKALAVAALAYFVCPLDAIPDITPFAGYADDLVVVTVALNEIHKALQDTKVRMG